MKIKILRALTDDEVKKFGFHQDAAEVEVTDAKGTKMIEAGVARNFEPGAGRHLAQGEVPVNE